MIVDRRGDHHLVGPRRRDQRREPFAHRRRAADEHAGAIGPHALAVGRRVRIGRGFFRARERQVLAFRTAHEVEVDGRREPLGFLVGIGGDHRNAEDRVGTLAPRRGPEAVAITRHRGGRVVAREMMSEREARADRRGKRGAVVARAEQPDRRQLHVGRHGAHLTKRMTGRKLAALPQHQFLKALEEVVFGPHVLARAQRQRRHRIGARRAPDAEVDPSRKQRFEHLEPLRHHQRGMVRQHDAARADPHARRHRSDLPDHEVGRRARDRRQVVMLGKPVTRIAEPVGKLRQIEAVAQRGGTRAGRGHKRQVENRKREHGGRWAGRRCSTLSDAHLISDTVI